MLSVTNHTFKDAHNEHCTTTTAQNAQFLFVQGKTSSSLRTSKKETSDKLSGKKNDTGKSKNQNRPEWQQAALPGSKVPSPQIKSSFLPRIFPKFPKPEKFLKREISARNTSL